MSDPKQFLRLFRYDRWSNGKILDRLQRHTDFDERADAVQMFYHILSVSRTWYRRVSKSGSTDIPLWPDRTVIGDAEQQLDELIKNWLSLIRESPEELERTISYENSSGESFEQRISDLLHHVIIHGQHHRAQIAKMLRRGGIPPPQTDFLFYLRDETDSSL